MIPSVSVSERIKEFNKSLLPNQVQLKYKSMTENAYRFFRGSCHLFYEDLSKSPSFPSSPLVWSCGDLHLENFGSYKANNRFVYFDQNDFDESLLAPAAWELVRMITSVFVAFDVLHIKEKHVHEWAELHLKTYFETLKGGKAKHIEARLAKGIVRSFLERISKRSPKELLHKQVEKKKKKHYQFIYNQKHLPIEEDVKAQLINHFENSISSKNRKLSEYLVEDVAFRIAGTGSLGVKRYVFLIQNQKKKKDFLLLDMKESRPSSVLKYTSIVQPLWTSHAEREVAIQSRMQYATDALTGSTEFKGDSFVVQELQPEEDKIDFSLLINRDKDVTCVLEDMAVLTASGQLRSSGRQGSAIADELIELSKNSKWQSDILAYALPYSKQVLTDYQQFFQDYKKGYFK